METVSKKCLDCGGEFLVGYKQSYTKYCPECYDIRMPVVQAACIAVKKAVIRGELPSVRSKLCVDCGAPASCYDHRNYDFPLSVEPVCWSCNRRRGTAPFTKKVAA